MGKRGPKPKPADLESAQGFPGRRKRQTRAVLTPQADVQVETHDSRFVPPIPKHLLKRERTLWAAVWSNPANATLLKTTDHGAVAMWCQLEYQCELFRQKRPAAVIEESKVTVDANGNSVTSTKTKRNPEYDLMLATMRELRAVQQTLGFNPSARLNVDARLGNARPEGGSADPGRTKPPGAPAGPLGALRTPRPN